ncbi:MAG: DUF3786 domain-containing protein [Actinomycetota bacterium]|nr:DUF3786 domain-containing protein [Actinomycetota bacterium]
MIEEHKSPFDEPKEILKSLPPEVVAKRAKVKWEQTKQGVGKFLVSVLAGTITVSIPEFETFAPVELSSYSMSLLTLIYLSRASGTPPTGKWISFREITGGMFYEPVFQRSVENPVATRFGDDIESFRQKSMQLGGKREDMGDLSFTFSLFPLIKICFVLWKSNIEFPSRCVVLFDSAAPKHLGAFELRMGAQEICSRLIK